VALDGLGARGLRAVDGAAPLQRLEQPGLCLAGVREGLERRERLGRDDEQGRLRVEPEDLLGDVVGVDVGDETGLDAGVRVGLERLVDHDRAEVGAADADVDDGLDALAGDAGPPAGADVVGEGVDAVERLAHVLHAVLVAVEYGAGVGGGLAQRGVEHGAVLGGVDVRAAHHEVAVALHVALARELHEQADRLVVDEVLGEVHVQAADVEGELLDALRVLREPALERDALLTQIRQMLLQRRPGLGLRGIDWCRDGCHVRLLLCGPARRALAFRRGAHAARLAFPGSSSDAIVRLAGPSFSMARREAGSASGAPT
jgi:hypothetical protein